MKLAARYLVPFSFLLAVSAPQLLHAQETFREADTPSELAPVAPPTQEQLEKYNLKAGPVDLNIAAGVGVEFNDNINLAPSGQRESDIIIRPSVDLDAAYPLSDLNTLRFSLGISYAKYLNHSEFDTRGVLLSPNSLLALTVQIGQVQLTFKERFSYQEDPYDLPIISNAAVYRRYENTAGIQADWSINDYVKLTGGYDHYNLWALGSEFSSLSRSQDTVYIKPSVAISPSVNVGVNLSAGYIDFTEDNQSDGWALLAGPFIEATITQYTHAYLEAGYQKFTYDDHGVDTGTGGLLDDSEASSWYVRSEITNQLSDSFSQRLAFSKTEEIGFGSDYYTLYHLEYGADWKVMQGLSLAPTAFYEHYKTSGADSETANRYGTAIGLRYIVTPSLTLGADYRFLLKNTDIADADYKQNLVLLSLYYTF